MPFPYPGTCLDLSNTMDELFAPENRLLASFLRGARPPVLRGAFFLSYRREGADLHSLYRPAHVARRLRPAHGRRPGVCWVSPRDRLLRWRLGEAAKAVGLRVTLVETRATPADEAEALRWLEWRQAAHDLAQGLRKKGYLTPEGLDAIIGFPRTDVTAALRARPWLLERYPTRFLGATPRGGGAAVQQEAWVTPAGVDVVGMATALALGQGLRFGVALGLVADGIR